MLLIWAGYTAVKPTLNTGCISPPVSIAYPFETFRTPADGGGRPDVLPPRVWKAQLSGQQVQEIGLFSAKSIVVYQDDVWFTDSDLLARYRPSTRELETYVVEVDQESVFVPYQLFVAHNSATLWGIGGGGLELHRSGKFTGILSRYDAETDRFEPVLDENKILAPTAGYIPLTEDTQGKLWLVIDSKLYSYDPVTNQAQRELDRTPEILFHGLVGASDGTLWLAVVVEEWSASLMIARYDPRTEKLEYHGSPPEIGNEVFVDLYVDRHNRLWVSDYGWLQLTGKGEWEWYYVVHSPVFITNRMVSAGDFQYVWSRPFWVYESSNGLFWFSSTAGLVKLDPQSGEWCLFTTLFSPVVEDDQKNLWIAGARQLYKYSLNR